MNTEKQTESATKIVKYWSSLKTLSVKYKPWILNVVRAMCWIYKAWPLLDHIVKWLFG